MCERLLDLPAELLIKIVNSCVEYDLPDTRHAEYTEQQAYPHDYLPNDRQRLTWATILTSSKRDISNIRLACRQLRDLSHEGFAEILGDRRFRLTRQGLSDFGEIANNKCLAPWIRTLTFGCAFFRLDFEPIEHEVRRYLCIPEVDDDDESNRIRIDAIRTAYAKIADEEHDALEDDQHSSELEKIIKRFPNLETANMVVFDRPSYLGGWLTQENRHFIESDCMIWGQWGTKPCDPSSFYTCENEWVARDIARAFQATDKPLKDLRFSNAPPFLYLKGYSEFPFSHALRTLRICVERSDFISSLDANGTRRVAFLHTLENLNNLEDLTLTLDLYHHHSNLDYEHESHSKAFDVFRALSPRCEKASVPRECSAEISRTIAKGTTKLRRFVLKGSWAVSERHLLEFIDDHASTLRCLILYGSILGGNWTRALHSIAQITGSTLEYISVLFPKTIVGPKGAFVRTLLDDDGVEALGFKCNVDFGSRAAETRESGDEDFADDEDSDGEGRGGGGGRKGL